MINAQEYATKFESKVRTGINKALNSDFVGIEPTSSDEIKQIEAPPEAILLTEENCSACDFAKTALENDITEGKIRVCDLNNEECKQIGRSIDLKEVPAMVIEDENGKLVQCEMGKEGENGIVISCPVMPNMNVEEAPRKPSRHGKLGIACMDFRIKNGLMTDAKNAGLSQEDIMKIYSLPECENQVIGFAPVKTGKGATDTKTSKRGAFMRTCLKDSSKGDRQPDRMRKCSSEYRELKEQGKIK